MVSLAAVTTQTAAPPKIQRQGVAAVLDDQTTLDRVQATMRDLHLDEELVLEPTLDAVMARIRQGYAPRVLAVDLSDSPAPMAELGAAREIGGKDLKIVAIGSVNDVGVFRDLRGAGASDYLVKPVSRDALSAALAKRENGLGEVVALIGSRGGLGATTTAVSCAWLLGEKRHERTALVDMDLQFGTVGLKLDTDPGKALCDALEQPAIIDSLFIDHAMIKLSDRVHMLAAEAALGETLTVDPRAINVLLCELRRSFDWVLVDLPRCMTPAHRVVLTSATRVVVMCERSLAGLRDTLRLKSLLHENAPQARLLLVDSGAAGERSIIGKPDFEKKVGRRFDAILPHDLESATAATSAGRPLPATAPRSALSRELEQLVSSLARSGAAEKRKLFAWARR
jgi:pilus assembly protein CpaE